MCRILDAAGARHFFDGGVVADREARDARRSDDAPRIQAGATLHIGPLADTPPDRPERRNEKVWAHPVIADGRLYVRDLESVWCYDVRDTAAAAAAR